MGVCLRLTMAPSVSDSVDTSRELRFAGARDRGSLISQMMPSASINSSALPPSPLALCSISDMPKPCFIGALTAGPPRSAHLSRSVSLLTAQLMVTVPSAFNSALLVRVCAEFMQYQGKMQCHLWFEMHRRPPRRYPRLVYGSGQ